MNHTEDHSEPTSTPPAEMPNEATADARSPGRRRRLAIWVVLVAVFSVVFFQSPAGPPVGWSADLEGALVQAKTGGRHVVVAFHGAHCPPCHTMDMTVLGKPPVQKALAEFVPVRIDPNQHPEAAQRYQIFATPTYAVLDADGDVVHQIIGPRSVDEFVAFLETSLGLASNPPLPGA